MFEPKLPGFDARSIKLPPWVFGMDLFDGMGCRKAAFTFEDADTGEHPHFTIYWRDATEAMRSDWGEECLVYEDGDSPNSGTLTVYPSLPEALRHLLKGDPYSRELWKACVVLGEISPEDASQLQVDLACLLDAGWPEHIDPLAD